MSWWFLALVLFSSGCSSPSSQGAAPALSVHPTPCSGSTQSPTARIASTGARHYEYVFLDGAIHVYDMDNGHCQVKSSSVPTQAGVRGASASPATGMLYIAYGGDGGVHGNGSLLKYDLRSEKVIWIKNYTFGIDSFDITPDGKTIYMPEGELASGSGWYVLDAESGADAGVIQAGKGPHNTLVSRDGRHVYMGPRFDPYLYVADTFSNRIVRRVGPLRGDGVRPFTINGAQTIAYIAETGFLGFQIGDLQTGKILYTVPVHGFSVPSDFPATAPSHGISLSPDEREIYLIDSANSQVHVFDVSALPHSPPKQTADITLQSSMKGNESPCAYDCLRDGWVQHSRDGRYVYVGDSGDVIDTTTHKTAVVLEPLHNTRKMLEIDFDADGAPSFATPREGIGYDQSRS